MAVATRGRQLVLTRNSLQCSEMTTLQTAARQRTARHPPLPTRYPDRSQTCLRYRPSRPHGPWRSGGRTRTPRHSQASARDHNWPRCGGGEPVSRSWSTSASPSRRRPHSDPRGDPRPHRPARALHRLPAPPGRANGRAMRGPAPSARGPRQSPLAVTAPFEGLSPNPHPRRAAARPRAWRGGATPHPGAGEPARAALAARPAGAVPRLLAGEGRAARGRPHRRRLRRPRHQHRQGSQPPPPTRPPGPDSRARGRAPCRRPAVGPHGAPARRHARHRPRTRRRRRAPRDDRRPHDQALRDLGGFVHRTVVENDDVYAVRIDDGVLLDAAEQIDHARRHLTPADRTQAAAALGCKTDKLDAELDALAARARSHALKLRVDGALRDRAAKAATPGRSTAARTSPRASGSSTPSSWSTPSASSSATPTPRPSARIAISLALDSTTTPCASPPRTTASAGPPSGARHAEATTSNLGLSHDIRAALADPTDDQLHAVREIVCRLLHALPRRHRLRRRLDRPRAPAACRRHRPPRARPRRWRGQERHDVRAYRGPRPATPRMRPHGRARRAGRRRGLPSRTARATPRYA